MLVLYGVRKINLPAGARRTYDRRVFGFELPRGIRFVGREHCQNLQQPSLKTRERESWADTHSADLLWSGCCAYCTFARSAPEQTRPTVDSSLSEEKRQDTTLQTCNVAVFTCFKPVWKWHEFDSVRSKFGADLRCVAGGQRGFPYPRP